MEPPATVEAMCSAAAEGDLPELRRLLAADPELAKSTSGAGSRTPLWHAAAKGTEDAVRLLLEVAPVAALTADAVVGWLSLHAAAIYAKAEVVRLLLEAAAAAALKADGWGRLPLHWAAHCGDSEVVRLLVDAAPAAMRATKFGSLPVMLALSQAADPDKARNYACYLATASCCQQPRQKWHWRLWKTPARRRCPSLPTSLPAQRCPLHSGSACRPPAPPWALPSPPCWRALLRRLRCWWAACRPRCARACTPAPCAWGGRRRSTALRCPGSLWARCWRWRRGPNRDRV